MGSQFNDSQNPVIRAEFERFAYPVKHRFLGDGESESAIMLQIWINEKIENGELEGHELVVDGEFGSKTKNMVANYQKKHNIKETGYVNDTTFKAMHSDGFHLFGDDGYIKKKDDFLNGEKARETEITGMSLVQVFLNSQLEAGKLVGEKLIQDGYNGRNTKTLLSQYQSNHGINATGVADDNTFMAMEKDGLVFSGEGGYVKSHVNIQSIEKKEYFKRFMYAVGGEKKGSAIELANPPRVGVSVAALQYILNDDFKNSGKSDLQIPINGVFDAKTQEALKKWQADKSLHPKIKGEFVELESNGKFDFPTYLAFFLDKEKERIDFAEFKIALLNSNSGIAKELGDDAVKKINTLEVHEYARRGEIGGKKIYSENNDVVLPNIARYAVESSTKKSIIS